MSSPERFVTLSVVKPCNNTTNRSQWCIEADLGSRQAYLCAGRVDADRVGEVGLRRAHLHAESEALCDLTGVWSQNVKANHALLFHTNKEMNQT